MKQYLISALLSFLAIGVFGQYQNVEISDVSSPNEPSIVMNPKNTDELVAGANLRSFYFSVDGGLTWTRQGMQSDYGVAGDPCFIVDTAGNFYFFHLSSPPGGSWLDRIVCQKFDMETEEWIADTYMGLNGVKDQDKEWAVVDSATNTIYVTWTQFDQYGVSNPDKFSNIIFSKSTDGGLSWSEGLQINEVSGNCIDSDNTTEGAVPAVGPNGEIYVAWSINDSIVFDRSLDGGQTWLDEDIFVSTQPEGWDYGVPGIYRCNGLPVTVCDISNSPYKGTIYVNWSDQRNGSDDTDIWLSKSTDGGDTWTTAMRVNDDAPGKQQFLSWMTVDQANGDVYIVFYDRRNYDDDNTDVYLARSTNGGETFENILISESPFLPSSSVFFGDYTNITAHNKQVRPIWARADWTDMSIWTAIIDMTVGIAEADNFAPFSLAQNYPNPFTETTHFSYKLSASSRITLTVYDVYGRQIVRIIDNEMKSAGKHTEPFAAGDYKLPTGVYYFTLSQKDQVKKRKMLLIE
ncbi:MAG: T9SS type A sorting domain-containing protein [Bacteroidales bacterium]|nr:T9SS type A sorting domain-containing protein [Bacteroidales bacterium]